VPCLRLVEYFADGGKLLEVGERRELEGIVSKRRVAPYRSSECRDWRGIGARSRQRLGPQRTERGGGCSKSVELGIIRYAPASAGAIFIEADERDGPGVRLGGTKAKR
jgi:hypothetical protein